MKVLVAGATGAIGKQLLPRLRADGHEVSAMTRSDAKRAEIEALGATPGRAPTRSTPSRSRARSPRPSRRRSSTS